MKVEKDKPMYFEGGEGRRARGRENLFSKGQRKVTEAYREGWERIYGGRGDEEEEIDLGRRRDDGNITN